MTSSPCTKLPAHRWTTPADMAGEMLTPAAAPDSTSSPSPAEPQYIAASRRIHHTQEQVDEVVRIMHANVDNLISVDIHESDDQYQYNMAELIWECCWKHSKILLIVGLICVALLLIICIYCLT